MSLLDEMYEDNQTKALFDILKGLSKAIEKPLFEISAKYDPDLKEALKDDGFQDTFEDNNFQLSKAFEHSQEQINKERVVSEHSEEAYKILKERGVYYPNMEKYFKQIGVNEYQYYPEDKKHYSTKRGERFDAQDTCIDEKEMAALKKNLGTRSGKVECFLHTMIENNQDPMPTWRDSLYRETPKRLHSAIDNKTPNEVYLKYINNLKFQNQALRIVS